VQWSSPECHGEQARAQADDFPTLAPGVPRGTDLSHSPLRGFAVRGLGQSAPSGRLARAINVEDHSLFACSINKPACLSLVAKAGEPADRRETGSAGLRQAPGRSALKKRERVERAGKLWRAICAMKDSAQGSTAW
jgi:hypothetical protein